MAIRIIQVFRARPHNKIKHLWDTNTYLVIRLPDSWVLRILAKSMLLALLIVSVPWLNRATAGGSFDIHTSTSRLGPTNVNLDPLPLLFHDLKNEGLLKTGDGALFVSNGGEVSHNDILTDNDMVVVSATDSERQSSIPNESFDFTFAYSFHAATEFIDRTIRVGGIVATQLKSEEKSNSLEFNKPSNYQIVYIKRFEYSTILAMKKIDYAATTTGGPKRRLFGYATEAKKAALKNLEDVLLEPPRAASGRSRTYLKRTKYLPDLMGDSLESYPRRVFIDVGLPEREGGSGTGWFAKNYPTRNLHFEMYKIETVNEDSVPQIGMSDWLRVNVKEEEYVVMKAEAEVVEEMVKSEAVSLVDELFLECKPKGIGGRKNIINGSRRAYWECLALYGKLRDEGVAVHQWWG